MPEDKGLPRTVRHVFKIALGDTPDQKYEDVDWELVLPLRNAGAPDHCYILFPPGMERKERNFYERGTANSCFEPWPTLQQYQPLDPAKKEIRVFMMDCFESNDQPICGRLETISLSSAEIPQYIALSYHWGSDLETQHIYVNGERMQIRKTLWSFLRNVRARMKKCHRFWADFLCINQMDTAERNSQVSMMSKVYSEAVMVYAWLGDKTPNTEAFCDRLDSLSGASLEEKDIALALLDHRMLDVTIDDPEPKVPPWVVGVRELSLHPYWSRLWIVQELVLAQFVYLLTGDRHITLADFNLTQRRCRDMPWPRCYRKVQDIARISNDIRFDGRYPSLAGLLYAFGDSQCSEARDKVYGLLAMLTKEDQLEWAVDYNMEPAILWCLIANYFEKRRALMARTMYLELLGRLVDHLWVSDVIFQLPGTITVFPLRLSQLCSVQTASRIGLTPDTWSTAVILLEHELLIADGKMKADLPEKLQREIHFTTVISDCDILPGDRMLAFEKNLRFWTVFRNVDEVQVNVDRASCLHLFPSDVIGDEDKPIHEQIRPTFAFIAAWQRKSERCGIPIWKWPVDTSAHNLLDSIGEAKSVLASPLELTTSMLAEVVLNSCPKHEADVEWDIERFSHDRLIRHDGRLLLNACWVISKAAARKELVALKKHVRFTYQIPNRWTVVNEDDLVVFQGYEPNKRLPMPAGEALVHAKAQAMKQWSAATDIDLSDAEDVYSESPDIARELLLRARTLDTTERSLQPLPASDDGEGEESLSSDNGLDGLMPGEAGRQRGAHKYEDVEIRTVRKRRSQISAEEIEANAENARSAPAYPRIAIL